MEKLKLKKLKKNSMNISLENSETFYKLNEDLSPIQRSKGAKLSPLRKTTGKYFTKKRVRHNLHSIQNGRNVMRKCSSGSELSFSNQLNDDSEVTYTDFSNANSTFRRTKHIKLKIKPVQSIIIEKQQESAKHKKAIGERSKSTSTAATLPKVAVTQSEMRNTIRSVLSRYPGVIQSSHMTWKMMSPEKKTDLGNSKSFDLYSITKKPFESSKRSVCKGVNPKMLPINLLSAAKSRSVLRNLPSHHNSRSHSHLHAPKNPKGNFPRNAPFYHPDLVQNLPKILRMDDGGESNFKRKFVGNRRVEKEIRKVSAKMRVPTPNKNAHSFHCQPTNHHLGLKISPKLRIARAKNQIFQNCNLMSFLKKCQAASTNT